MPKVEMDDAAIDAIMRHPNKEEELRLTEVQRLYDHFTNHAEVFVQYLKKTERDDN